MWPPLFLWNVLVSQNLLLWSAGVLGGRGEGWREEGAVLGGSTVLKEGARYKRLNGHKLFAE